jgi:hypothetical protein
VIGTDLGVLSFSDCHSSARSCKHHDEVHSENT